jgi:hypothetical protein
MNFEELAGKLEDQGATVGKMFGHRCLKVGRKVFATDHGETLNLKLPEPQRSQTLELKGARSFEPMPGRKMGEWVEVPSSYKDQWLQLAEVSMDYVARLNL